MIRIVMACPPSSRAGGARDLCLRFPRQVRSGCLTTVMLDRAQAQNVAASGTTDTPSAGGIVLGSWS